jgi:hypothetical protein
LDRAIAELVGRARLEKATIPSAVDTILQCREVAALRALEGSPTVIALIVAFSLGELVVGALAATVLV